MNNFIVWFYTKEYIWLFFLNENPWIWLFQKMISIIPILFSEQNLVESSEWIELHNNNNEIEASLSTVHTIHTPVPTQKNIVVWLTTRFPGAEIDARETFVIFFWYGVGCHWFFSAQLKGYWFSTHQRSSQIFLWFLCIVQVFLSNVFAMFITWGRTQTTWTIFWTFLTPLPLHGQFY